MKYRTRIENLKQYDVYKDGKYICSGNINEIAEKLHVCRKTVVRYKRENKYEFKEIDCSGSEFKDYDKREYALYEDDTFLTIGTLDEIAKWLEIKYVTLITYKSKKIKYIFVKV